MHHLYGFYTYITFFAFLAIKSETKFFKGNFLNKSVCPRPFSQLLPKISCQNSTKPYHIIRRHQREVNISGPLTIPIGSIFNPKDFQCRSAFKLASTLFNESPGKNFKTRISMDIIDVADSFKLATTICSQMSKGVFLFFGMSSIRSMDIVRSYCNRFHMPYISPSLADVSVHMDPLGFQLHMKPPYTDAIVDMIQHYRWKAVHYLYDSEEGLQRLQQIFRSEKSKYAIRFAFRRLDNVYKAHEDLKHLDQNADEEVKKIVLDLSSREAYVAIMRQIAEVGMNKYGYFYLLATMDFSSLDFRRFLHGGVNLTGFDILDRNNEKLINFTKEWSTANTNEYPGAEGPLMSDAALAVDSLQLVVESVKKMLDMQPDIFQTTFRRKDMYNMNVKGIPCNKRDRHFPEPLPWMHGPALMDALKHIEFEGLTGHVTFRNVGFRKNYTMQVSTVGLHQEPVKIGTWKPKLGYISLSDEPIPPTVNKSVKKRITTIMSKPFLMKNDKIEEKDIKDPNDRYMGYAAELAKRLAEIVNFEYELHEVEDGEYGINFTDENGNETWSGMIGELISGKADLAIAPLTITYNRERVVDFTKPFMDVGISIMIKKPDIEKPGVFSFMSPLSWQIWVCIMIGYASVSIGLFLVSRFSPYEWRKIMSGKGVSYENDFSVLNSFWFSTGALMLQGSDSCPRSNSGRIIGTVWWFFVLIIISSYTANLAAFLTIERMVAPIESADDLVKQTEIKYGSLDSGTTRMFFENSKVPTYERMWTFMSTSGSMVQSVEDGIARVREKKGKYAFLLDSTTNEYINSQEPCDTMKVGRNLNAKGFGIATPQDSDLQDALNLAVLELKEDGTLHRLRQTWWHDKSQCAANSKDSGSKKRSLSLSNVAGVFYILIGGLVLAVILGALEFTFKKLRLIPKGAYMSAAVTEQSLVRTPSERENGGIGEYPAHFSPDYQPDKGVQTFTYGTPNVPPIGFEALGDRNAHTNV